MPQPYQIAVLCYLYDEDNRLLLLHRAKPPNLGQYSPVGGKLEMADGEGVHECAVREIEEETGVTLDLDEIRMIGLVSERAYEGKGHWMIFLFESTRPIRHDELAWSEFDEGALEWIHVDEVADLDIPATDRTVMWPLVQSHRGGYFVVHIDCSKDPFTWRLHESVPAPGSAGG